GGRGRTSRRAITHNHNQQGEDKFVATPKPAKLKVNRVKIVESAKWYNEPTSPSYPDASPPYSSAIPITAPPPPQSIPPLYVAPPPPPMPTFGPPIRAEPPCHDMSPPVQNNPPPSTPIIPSPILPSPYPIIPSPPYIPYTPNTPLLPSPLITYPPPIIQYPPPIAYTSPPTPIMPSPPYLQYPPPPISSPIIPTYPPPYTTISPAYPPPPTITYSPPPPPYTPSTPPGQGLWCVAKPTIAASVIEQAMNYACGAGADCQAIQPNGACYLPDTVIAHASYSFNSYFQATKGSGGSCDFGGTAMIVTVDP
ncbi:hypothetical protein KI387_042175, partial [Taxus chinensis]